MDRERRELQHSDFIPVECMTRVYNPISLSLNSTDSSMQNGVKGKLNVQEPGFMLACWGAGIAEIYPIIYMPWRNLKTIFHDETKAKEFMREKCQSVSVIKCLNCCEDEEVTIKPEHVPDLSILPRDRYPVVVFIVSESLQIDISQINNPTHNTVVFQAVIYHLKDEICPYESHVISHFVRCIDSAPHDLKQLYSSGNVDNTTSCSRNNSSEAYILSNDNLADNPMPCNASEDRCTYEKNGDICVVCQVDVVNKVFLPCRHACVCNQCFTKVEKCPMCRGNIQSCFNLSNSHAEEPIDSVADDEHWIYRLNNWLNRSFGFT